jgi:hypothetical protein
MPEIIRIKRLDGHTRDVALEVPGPFDNVDIEVFLLFMNNQMGIRSATSPDSSSPSVEVPAPKIGPFTLQSTAYRARGWETKSNNGSGPCLTITTTFLSSGIVCPVVVLIRRKGGMTPSPHVASPSTYYSTNIFLTSG